MRPTKLAIIYDKTEKARQRDEEMNNLIQYITQKLLAIKQRCWR
jgi:ABC-type enterochelin transport system substrate-binding protein